MANGTNGNRLLYGIVTGLTISMVAGGVTLGWAAAGDRVRIANVEKVSEGNSEIVKGVPVMANELGHIKESIEDIEETQDEILDAIRALSK